MQPKPRFKKFDTWRSIDVELVEGEFTLGNETALNCELGLMTRWEGLQSPFCWEENHPISQEESVKIETI